MVLKMYPSSNSKVKSSLNLYSVMNVPDINIDAIVMTGTPILSIKGKNEGGNTNRLAVYFDGLSLKDGLNLKSGQSTDFTFVMELLGQLNVLRLTSK
jgi:hypothetical protein